MLKFSVFVHYGSLTFFFVHFKEGVVDWFGCTGQKYPDAQILTCMHGVHILNVHIHTVKNTHNPLLTDARCSHPASLFEEPITSRNVINMNQVESRGYKALPYPSAELSYSP